MNFHRELWAPSSASRMRNGPGLSRVPLRAPVRSPSSSSVLLLKRKPLEGSTVLSSTLCAPCLYRAECGIDDSFFNDSSISII